MADGRRGRLSAGCGAAASSRRAGGVAKREGKKIAGAPTAEGNNTVQFGLVLQFGQILLYVLFIGK